MVAVFTNHTLFYHFLLLISVKKKGKNILLANMKEKISAKMWLDGKIR